MTKTATVVSRITPTENRSLSKTFYDQPLTCDREDRTNELKGSDWPNSLDWGSDVVGTRSALAPVQRGSHRAFGRQQDCVDGFGTLHWRDALDNHSEIVEAGFTMPDEKPFVRQHPRLHAQVSQCVAPGCPSDRTTTGPPGLLQSQLVTALGAASTLCEACKEVEILKEEERLIMAETAAPWSHECPNRRMK